MGLIEDIFANKTRGRGFEKIPLTDVQRQAQAGLLGIGVGDIESPVRQIAPPTQTELFGFNRLSDFARGDVPGLETSIGLARDLATTPVTAENIPGFRATETAVRRSGELGINRVLRGLGQRGALSSTTGGRVAGQAAGEASTQLAAALAPLEERAESRRVGAITTLAQLGEAADAGELRRLEATQRFTLERDLVQAGFDATQASKIADIEIKFRQDQLRLQALAQILGGPGFAFDPGTTSPSIFSQVAGAFTGFSQKKEAA